MRSLPASIAAIAAVAATSLLATPSPAQTLYAAPTPDQTPPARSTAERPGPQYASAESATGRAEQHKVREYWTTRRMQDAIPADQALKPESSTSTTFDEPQLASATNGGSRWTAGGDVVKTTGKVFFSHGGLDYVCSGSVVEGVSRSMVITAGHCVFDAGRWSSNWAFVPAYDNGNRPYGTWTANNLYTTRAWYNHLNTRYDVGMARLNPNGDGQSIVTAVGSQSILFNRTFAARRYVFGYPAQAPYDGERLIYCSGRTGGDPYSDTGAHSIACNLKPGASGGPWFWAFDETTGRGFINSVSSYYYPGLAVPRFYGPYFGKAIQAFYASVQPLPRNGSFIKVRETGKAFRIVGGAPIPVPRWAPYGGPKPVSWVTAPYLERLPAYPADGTFVQAIQTSTFYRMVGGAPIIVTNFSVFGGPKPAVGVDAYRIRLYQGFRHYPLDGFIQGAPQGTIYRTVLDGHPYVVRSWAPYGGPQPRVVVQRSSVVACDHLNCSPFGGLEGVTKTRAGFRVMGWAMDGNAPGSIDISVVVGGQKRPVVHANAVRRDLGTRFHRGSRFGYDTQVRATAGKHRVCVLAYNRQRGSDVILGCRIVRR